MNSIIIPMEIHFCNQCPDCIRIEYLVPGRKHALGKGSKHICFNKGFLYPQVVGEDILQPYIPSGCPRITHKIVVEKVSPLPEPIIIGPKISDICAKISEMLYPSSK